MATLHIEHAITDLDTWMGAFTAFSEARRGAGVRSERIQRPVGDDRFIVVDLDFDSADAAAGFLQFLETQVSSVPGNPTAPHGAPRTLILETLAPPRVAR